MILGEDSMLEALVETAPAVGYKRNSSPCEVMHFEDDGTANLRERS